MPQFDGKPTRSELKRAADAAPASGHVRELAARPRCAVCGRPVERMTEEEDTCRDVVIFTAWCHGQRDTVKLDAGDPRLKGITFGVAFASSPRRLEAP